MSHCIDSAGRGPAVHTVAAAEAFIAHVCFKHGPPRRFGIELEWLLDDPSDPERRPDADLLRTLLGEHAPRSLTVDGPARALPGGSSVSVEPGGQVELSSAPADSVGQLVAAVSQDIAALHSLLAPSGFRMSDDSWDLHRSPRRILDTPRYRAMERAFDQRSPAGRRMMCGSAALQVCLDLGTEVEAPLRWRAAHLIGPPLLAAFANTHLPDGPWSPRMASWWTVDPSRTLPPDNLDPAAYVRRVLDTEVLAIRASSGEWPVNRGTLRSWIERAAAGDVPAPCTDDIELHLSMIFPPVRPQGYLELRYLDCQPGRQWVTVLAVVAALFEVGTVEAVAHVCGEAGERWQQASLSGLRDPVLARASRELFELASPGLSVLGLPQAVEASVRRSARRRMVDDALAAASARASA
jgi:glutamate--cysteine ligase